MQVGVVQAAGEFAGEGGAEEVGPAASAVLFIPGGLEGGTHGADLQLATDPRTVAHFYGLGVTAIEGPVQQGLDVDGVVVGAVAQVLVGGQGVHHLVGIHQVMGVEDALDLSEEVVDVWAEEFGIEVAAGQAVAMLAAGHAAIFFGQPRRFSDQVDEVVDVFFFLLAEDGAHVDAARGGVCVHGRGHASVVHKLPQVTHVVGQVFGRHRHILDAGQRFFIPAHGKKQAQPSLAYFPHVGLFRRVGDGDHRILVAGAIQVSAQRGQAVVDPAGFISSKFHDVDDCGIAFDKGEAFVPGRGGAGETEEVVVDEFHRGGFQFQQAGHRAEGFLSAVEVKDGQGFVAWDGDQAQFGFQKDGQGALAAHQQGGEVEGVAIQLVTQVVQVVAARAPPVFGELLIDKGGVVANEGEQVAVEAGFDALALGQLLDAIPGLGAENGFLAVGEDHPQGVDVVHHAPIDDAVGAGAVVAQEAPYHGPVAAGRVGANHEAVAAQGLVEHVQGAAGLHPDFAFTAVDLDDLVHVFGEVDDHGFAHGLAREAGAAPAREDGEIVFNAGLYRGQDVVIMFGDDYGQGHHFVDGGVGAVEDAGGQVGFDLGRAVFAQGLREVLDVLLANVHEGMWEWGN